MADCMMFPKDWRDFIKDYSFIDSEQVYTNGSELIQVFRVIQLIEHLLKEQEGVEPIFDCEEPILRIGQFHCGNCNHSFGISHYRYCPYCGKPVKWKGE